VHAPILIFCFYLFADRAVIVGQLVGFAASLVVGTLFWWFFEKRAYQWSIATGRAASARFAAYQSARADRSAGAGS
jgi:peptidoglycan/LPS O-acetylase OafA/YrhL